MRPSQVLAVLTFLSASALAHAGAPTIAGTWRIIGDKSGEAEALVRITEQDGVVEGKIISIFPRPGVDPNALCDQCPGERRNQPIRGMTILAGFHQEEGEYKGGTILDPDTGDIYRCTIKMSADHKKLQVRGFIGIPLIGRTQTWVRE
ncbi:MAG: DUF2147 domain-containing protein [Betaproteobacteria bacterium]